MVARFRIYLPGETAKSERNSIRRPSKIPWEETPAVALPPAHGTETSDANCWGTLRQKWLEQKGYNLEKKGSQTYPMNLVQSVVRYRASRCPHNLGVSLAHGEMSVLSLSTKKNFSPCETSTDGRERHVAQRSLRDETICKQYKRKYNTFRH
jgi:hypothetical protein